MGKDELTTSYLGAGICLAESVVDAAFKLTGRNPKQREFESKALTPLWSTG